MRDAIDFVEPPPPPKLTCIDCGADVLAAPEVAMRMRKMVVVGWAYGDCQCPNGRGRWLRPEHLRDQPWLAMALGVAH